MNIFKVLASGKKSFQEETASAVLAWFLHPSMEHGLGNTLLYRFLTASGNPELKQLASRLTTKFGGEGNQDIKPEFHLEYPVDGAFIDILIKIDDWVIAVENKIYAHSVTKNQLTRELRGLKDEDPPKKIVLVYLVPAEPSGEKDIPDMPGGEIQEEFNRLNQEIEAPHLAILMTWQKNQIEKAPSIADIIIGILEDESKAVIEPVPEYTRHTLKALVAFISGNFAGYDYERNGRSLNSVTEDLFSVEQLKKKTEGYVGVKGGKAGLLGMDLNKIQTHKFQYTTQDMSKKYAWIPINTFNGITEWICEQKKPADGIDWDGRFPAKSLYAIAKDFGFEVFIGIKGGEDALRQMAPSEIKTRVWGISSKKANSQWISGDVFYDIVSGKGVF